MFRSRLAPSSQAITLAVLIVLASLSAAAWIALVAAR